MISGIAALIELFTQGASLALVILYRWKNKK